MVIAGRIWECQKVFIKTDKAIRSYQIINTTGQVLSRKTIQVQGTEKVVELSAAPLSAGVYLVRVIFVNGEVYMGKLIVPQ